VPEGVASYTTFNWDMEQAFEASKTLVNELAGDKVFEDVLQSIATDPSGPQIDIREELIAYDPGLAAICREVFGDTELSYTKPATRLTGHLEGYDPSTAPEFVWPEHLAEAKRQIRAAAESRNEKANAPE